MVMVFPSGRILNVTPWLAPGSLPASDLPPRDPQALAETILEALDSPDKRARLQERARRRAERLFTASRTIESTVSIYRELLDAA